MKNVFLFAVTVFLMSGCAMQAPQQARSGPGGVLMTHADQYVAAGEDAQAIALLERMVRIEPRNGHAWLRLAEIHFASGELNKAEQFARRAMQFAGTDKMLLRETQLLLDKVRRQMEQSG